MLLGKAASDMIRRRGGVNSLFEPLREETDQTGLELRKSLHRKALRIASAESIVTKRVALADLSRLRKNPIHDRRCRSCRYR